MVWSCVNNDRITILMLVNVILHVEISNTCVNSIRSVVILRLQPKSLIVLGICIASFTLE